MKRLLQKLVVWIMYIIHSYSKYGTRIVFSVGSVYSIPICIQRIYVFMVGVESKFNHDIL